MKIDIYDGPQGSPYAEHAKVIDPNGHNPEMLIAVIEEVRERAKSAVPYGDYMVLNKQGQWQQVDQIGLYANLLYTLDPAGCIFGTDALLELTKIIEESKDLKPGRWYYYKK